MEFFACIFGGIALMVCSLGLFRIRPPDWQTAGASSDSVQKSIERWSAFQRKTRYVNNALMALAGGAIFGTAFVAHGRMWVLLWTAILVLLLVCILLAMVDALTSLTGYRKALPEAARRSLGNEHNDSVN